MVCATGFYDEKPAIVFLVDLDQKIEDARQQPSLGANFDRLLLLAR